MTGIIAQELYSYKITYCVSVDFIGKESHELKAHSCTWEELIYRWFAVET
jgi:hypothetical protein